MTETHLFAKLLLNVDEVTELVGLSPSTIWRRLDEGSFPKPKKRRGMGSRALWLRADLEKWAKKEER